MPFPVLLRVDCDGEVLPSCRSKQFVPLFLIYLNLVPLASVGQFSVLYLKLGHYIIRTINQEIERGNVGRNRHSHIIRTDAGFCINTRKARRQRRMLGAGSNQKQKKKDSVFHDNQFVWAVEKIARERYHMKRADEDVFVFVSDKEENSEEPAETDEE